MNNEHEMPPLPGHPEHGWVWTDAEQRAIRAYAAASVAAERERLRHALTIEMQHSAWDGVLQLDDALRNIADALAQAP